MKDYKYALYLWVMLYVFASIVGIIFWFVLSPEISNALIIIFTPVVVFLLARKYFKKVEVPSPAREGVYLAAMWAVLGILVDVILYVAVAKYWTLYQYFVGQQPYITIWNIGMVFGGYFAGKTTENKRG